MSQENLNNEIKLSPREREIAIEAISRAPIGDCSRAAADLLAGIAVLGGAHLPVLVWPPEMPNDEKATWLEGEAASVRKRITWELEVTSSLASRRPSSVSSLEYRGIGCLTEPLGAPVLAAQSDKAPREELAEAVRAIAKTPDQETSDAFE